MLDAYAALRPGCALARVGLAITPEMPWLACSPDAIVHDGGEAGRGNPCEISEFSVRINDSVILNFPIYASL